MPKLLPFATFFYTVMVVFASLAKFVIPFVQKVAVPNSDKWAHAMAYFIFAAIWSFYFYYKKYEEDKVRTNFKKAIVQAAIFGVIFGFIMEVAQLVLTTYRSFDMIDALANTAGVVSASILLYLGSGFFKFN